MKKELLKLKEAIKEELEKRICPICKNAEMKPNGIIRPGGVGKRRTVYICPKCGHKHLL